MKSGVRRHRIESDSPCISFDNTLWERRRCEADRLRKDAEKQLAVLERAAEREMDQWLAHELAKLPVILLHG